ncbi:4-hydroxy-3-methylbut-2-enyl diphosphate reductase [Mariniphaga anaerophila]|uniref:4-hydroxy-3-methylbut-2-enyl diphosphate reductase n=1 Tax=Mariniphaga anaerophila TaxID=1484053 RepID=A0A1M5AIF4_9BACT|nr:4-hydroxy-3-methylbut-2-enyl diphosphate reductase [Mariniphaga anaerophila]SHF29906.1 4-hydroxy-3-methylbut-2-enyl diphosphate reductase [Mariniphaga anaerophila]
MRVEIDRRSGFCFGVIKAIKSAENELKTTDKLYCLGDIVHNGMEVERLEKMGLQSVSRDEYMQMKDCKVLIRAHGEPPETYEHAKKNNIELIDATCPVVLTLQEKVKGSYESNKDKDGQVVIYGKKGHAEIIGLDGQIENKAIVLESINDVSQIDFSRPVSLYSQTTKRVEDFYAIADKVKSSMQPGVGLEIKDSICRQVSNRVPHLKQFAKEFDVVLFVAGHKSSNGWYLYTICKEENPRTHHVARTSEIDPAWLDGAESVGICGATSTPNWLMEEIAEWINQRNPS